jgi:hypothetical protein
MQIWIYSSILLGLAFLLVIGILIRKIIQLSSTIKAKNNPSILGPKGNGKAGKIQAEPPPWAGGVDARTTVFVFPTLLVRDASDVEHSYRLGFEEFTIGRAPDNQLVVSSANVAAHHALIRLNDTGYIVEDLNTPLGTLVNGRKVGGKQTLGNEDCVTVGDTRIIFKMS